MHVQPRFASAVVALSPVIQKMQSVDYGISQDKLTPHEVMQAQTILLDDLTQALQKGDYQILEQPKGECKAKKYTLLDLDAPINMMHLLGLLSLGIVRPTTDRYQVEETRYSARFQSMGKTWRLQRSGGKDVDNSDFTLTCETGGGSFKYAKKDWYKTNLSRPENRFYYQIAGDLPLHSAFQYKSECLGSEHILVHGAHEFKQAAQGFLQTLEERVFDLHNPNPAAHPDFKDETFKNFSLVEKNRLKTLWSQYITPIRQHGIQVIEPPKMVYGPYNHQHYEAKIAIGEDVYRVSSQVGYRGSVENKTYDFTMKKEPLDSGAPELRLNIYDEVQMSPEPEYYCSRKEQHVTQVARQIAQAVHQVLYPQDKIATATLGKVQQFVKPLDISEDALPTPVQPIVFPDNVETPSWKQFGAVIAGTKVAEKLKGSAERLQKVVNTLANSQPTDPAQAASVNTPVLLPDSPKVDPRVQKCVALLRKTPWGLSGFELLHRIREMQKSSAWQPIKPEALQKLRSEAKETSWELRSLEYMLSQWDKVAVRVSRFSQEDVLKLLKVGAIEPNPLALLQQTGYLKPSGGSLQNPMYRLTSKAFETLAYDSPEALLKSGQISREDLKGVFQVEIDGLRGKEALQDDRLKALEQKHQEAADALQALSAQNAPHLLEVAQQTLNARSAQVQRAKEALQQRSEAVQRAIAELVHKQSLLDLDEDNVRLSDLVADTHQLVETANKQWEDVFNTIESTYAANLPLSPEDPQGTPSPCPAKE